MQAKLGLKNSSSDDQRSYNPYDYWTRRFASGLSLGRVGYLGLGEGFNSWLYRIRRVALEEAVRTFGIAAAGTQVIDIGVGTGFYIPIWKNLGVRHILAMDITETAVLNARDQWPEFSFVQCDVTSSVPESLPRGDIICCFDVLFHVVDDMAWAHALENCGALAKPDSWLLITDLFLKSGKLDGLHQKARSLNAYLQPLQAIGFVIVGRIPVFVLMHPPTDATGLKSAVLKTSWLLIRCILGIARLCGLLKPAGTILGALLYPVERILRNMISDGPSIELLVCRKSARARETIA